MNPLDTENQREPRLEADETPPSANDQGEPAAPIDNVWLPIERTLREELSQTRYLVLLVVALVAIGIQLWLLF